MNFFLCCHCRRFSINSSLDIYGNAGVYQVANDSPPGGNNTQRGKDIWLRIVYYYYNALTKCGNMSDEGEGLYLDRPLFNEHTYFTQGYVLKRGQIRRRTSHSITVFDRGENDHPQSKREYWTKIIPSIWPHVPLVYYDYTKANRRILFFREKSKVCPKSSFSP